ncbi:FixH family protein [Anaerobacillus sp. MEB173]|uniref:FixH family protein n=1 Tax=Anaerobacillus sp. MEB173 TaxID=3383345 RepID=UPI003F8F9EE6
MKRYSIILFIIFLFISGCSSNENSTPNTLAPLDVEFEMVPEQVQPGDVAQIKVFLSQDDKPVTDAREVLFEVWKHNGGEEHEMIEAENNGDGSYSIEWQFEEEWVYYVYYHVTAADAHRMQKFIIGVGDVNVDEIVDSGEAGRTQW